MEKTIAQMSLDNVELAFDNITLAIQTQEELKRNRYYYSPKEYKKGHEEISNLIVESLKLAYHVN